MPSAIVNRAAIKKRRVDKYNVIDYITDGNIVVKGKYSGQFKNPICKILNENNKEELLMLCNQNILCKLCPKSYQKILDYENKHYYFVYHIYFHF